MRGNGCDLTQQNQFYLFSVLPLGITTLFLWMRTLDCRFSLGRGLPVWTYRLYSASGQSYVVDFGSCRRVQS